MCICHIANAHQVKEICIETFTKTVESSLTMGVWSENVPAREHALKSTAPSPWCPHGAREG